MSDIFLSYTSDDRERVRPLVEALQHEGWSVFWDRTIPLGKMWHKMLSEELDACHCFVVVWSKHSVESEWVLEEAGLAKRKGLAIAPILLDAVDPPLGYQLIQAADLSAWDGSPASPLFQNLAREIKRILGPPAAPATEPVKPQPPEVEAPKPEPSEPPAAAPLPTKPAEARAETPKPPSRKLAWILGGIAVGMVVILFLIFGGSTPDSKRVPVLPRPEKAKKPEVDPGKQTSPAPKELAQIQPVTLPPPDFKKTPIRQVTQSLDLALKQVSMAPNKITDDAAWFAAHNLSLPELKVPNPFMRTRGTVPDFVSTEFQGLMLIRAIQSGDRLLLIYGENFAGGLMLLAQNIKNQKIEYALDFSNYQRVPGLPDHPAASEQKIRYAFQVDDTLYVSHGINGYAREALGRTAYVTAIEVRRLKPLWHSAPLVSNANNFELVGEYLITGYGFTDEPDFLYLLRRGDGEAVEKIPLKSGPDYIIRQGDRLYVRTYNTDYIFQLIKMLH